MWWRTVDAQYHWYDQSGWRKWNRWGVQNGEITGMEYQAQKDSGSSACWILTPFLDLIYLHWYRCCRSKLTHDPLGLSPGEASKCLAQGEASTCQNSKVGYGEHLVGIKSNIGLGCKSISHMYFLLLVLNLLQCTPNACSWKGRKISVHSSHITHQFLTFINLDLLPSLCGERQRQQLNS